MLTPLIYPSLVVEDGEAGLVVPLLQVLHGEAAVVLHVLQAAGLVALVVVGLRPLQLAGARPGMAVIEIERYRISKRFVICGVLSLPQLGSGTTQPGHSLLRDYALTS